MLSEEVLKNFPSSRTGPSSHRITSIPIMVSRNEIKEVLARCLGPWLGAQTTRGILYWDTLVLHCSVIFVHHGTKTTIWHNTVSQSIGGI